MTDLLLLPGDGIGPEVTAQVRRVAAKLAPDLTIVERPFGGISYDTLGTPLSDETIETALAADAVLMGAVGGPQWAAAPRHLRPEAGLLGLRKAMGVYANLRPALCFDALAGGSALKAEIIAGLDIMIVRELTGDIYFGEPRGIAVEDGKRVGRNTMIYNEDEIRRIGRVAFKSAQRRSKKLCSVDKMNVLETTQLWRDVMIELSAEYPDVELSHMLVDNAAKLYGFEG